MSANVKRASSVGQGGQDEEAPTSHPFPGETGGARVDLREDVEADPPRGELVKYVTFGSFVFSFLLLRHRAFGIIRA